MVPKLLLLLLGHALAQTPGTYIDFGTVTPGVSTPAPGFLGLKVGYSEGGAVSRAALQSGQSGGVVFMMPKLGAAANSTVSSSIRIGLGVSSSPTSRFDRYYKFENHQICQCLKKGGDYSCGRCYYSVCDTFAVLVSNNGTFQFWQWIYGREGGAYNPLGERQSAAPLYVHVWMTGLFRQVSFYSWIDGAGDLTLPTTPAPTSPTTTVLTTTTTTTTTHTTTTFVLPLQPTGGSDGPLLAAAAFLVCLVVGGLAGYIIYRRRKLAPARETNLLDGQSLQRPA